MYYITPEKRPRLYAGERTQLWKLVWREYDTLFKEVNTYVVESGLSYEQAKKLLHRRVFDDPCKVCGGLSCLDDCKLSL